jgi:hypothetical protein
MEGLKEKFSSVYQIKLWFVAFSMGVFDLLKNKETG